MSDPTQDNSVTFDEIERQNEAPPPAPDLTTIKLEGDDIPELLRGKTVADAIKQIGATQEALRISEQARTQQAAPPPPPPPAPEEPKDLSNEELNEIYQQDPVRALAVMQEQAQRRSDRNLEARLGPLTAGTAAQVENAARAKYPDEFELFGDQIVQFASQVPNGKAVLSNPAAWDDLIAIVRGRANNFERMIEHKTQRKVAPQRESAQRGQQDEVGFTDNSGGRGRPAGQTIVLDPIQKEICAKMNLTEAEYIKWSRVT